MTEPTDAELDAVLCNQWPAFSMQATLVRVWVRAAMRDALAKWGTPAGAGELRDAVIAYRSASEELLRAQMETLAQLGTTSLPIEQSWVKPFDEALLAQKKMYAVLDATPQPTQAHIEKCAVCGDGNARLLVMRNCDVCGSDYAGQSESEVNVALERARRATQAQAGAVPLTDEQIEEIAKQFITRVGSHWEHDDAIPDNGRIEDFVRAIEHAHGIKGADHD